MTTTADILHLRLRTQLIAAETHAASPADVVERLCAMQAQDYAGSLWAVGLRCRAGTTVADVERAIAERRIVRTWPMRGTLHLVAAADVRWMLALLAARIITSAATRQAQLGLTEADFDRAAQLFTDALSGGRSLTRPKAMALLESGGIATAGQRGYHILWLLAQRGLLCCGPVQAKQQTFVLLDEWIPPGPAEQDAPPQDVALARLAERYVAGHGPATVADLAWWAGITKADARAGLAAVERGLLESVQADGIEYWLPAGALAELGDTVSDSRAPRRAPDAHLLPGFDEYLLGYTDREPQLAGHYESFASTVSANGMLSSTAVIDGRVHGTWKRAVKRDRVDIVVRLFRELSAGERRALSYSAERFASFLGKEAALQFTLRAD